MSRIGHHGVPGIAREPRQRGVVFRQPVSEVQSASEDHQRPRRHGRIGQRKEHTRLVRAISGCTREKSMAKALAPASMMTVGDPEPEQIR